MTDFPPKDSVDSSEQDKLDWATVLRAGVKSQRLIPSAVAVGGSVAALYAGHRISHDVDHLVMGLKDTFDELLAILEASGEWKTNRIQRPVLILGSVDRVPIGFRHPRRSAEIATTRMMTSEGTLLVPTLDEMIGMKAFLTYRRNSLRDYLDFSALSTLVAEERVISALERLEDQYIGFQESSICLEVAKSLTAASPFDLEGDDLSRYRALAPEWRSWERTKKICQRFGVLLAEKVLGEIGDEAPPPDDARLDS